MYMELDKKEVEQRLKRKKTYLRRKFKVKTIGLFGSYVRNEAGSDSDVDLLVEFSEPVGFDFLRLKSFLENELGRKVDLGTMETIKPTLREAILGETEFL